jgi:hypothetical protein
MAVAIAFFESSEHGSIGASGEGAGFEAAEAGDGEGDALTPGAARNAAINARQEETVSDRFSIPQGSDAAAKDKARRVARVRHQTFRS